MEASCVRYEEDGRIYLGNVEIIPDSLRQYFGRHYLKRERLCDYRGDIFYDVRYRGVEEQKKEDGRFWYCYGDSYCFEDNFTKAYIIDGNKKQPVLLNSIRQLCPVCDEWIQILLRGKYDSPECSERDGTTVYCYGAMEYWGHSFRKEDGKFLPVKEDSVEQLVNAVPEIWVPLRFWGKPKEIKHVIKPLPVKKNPNPNDKKSCVYIFEFADGRTKIGIASNPEVRMRNLVTGGGYKCVSHYESDFFPRDEAREFEKKMHELYNDKRIEGEFFF